MRILESFQWNASWWWNLPTGQFGSVCRSNGIRIELKKDPDRAKQSSDMAQVVSRYYLADSQKWLSDTSIADWSTSHRRSSRIIISYTVVFSRKSPFHSRIWISYLSFFFTPFNVAEAATYQSETLRPARSNCRLQQTLKVSAKNSRPELISDSEIRRWLEREKLQEDLLEVLEWVNWKVKHWMLGRI